MTHVTNIRTADFSTMNRINAVRTALATRIAQQRMYHRTLNELRSLSVRELDDLGLNQNALKAVAYEAAYK